MPHAERTNSETGRADNAAGADEAALVAGARARDEASIRELTRRYNQRLFRIARAITRTDDDAEDAVQEGYVKAFTQLSRFRGEAAFSTWLTRIVMNEALARVRRERPSTEFSPETEPAIRARILAFPRGSHPPDPESAMSTTELRALLEQSIDALPDDFRGVFVARMIEGLSIEETAALFGLKPETVKTRVHRARAKLRREIEARVGPVAGGAFPFAGDRCERMTEAVVARLRRSA